MQKTFMVNLLQTVRCMICMELPPHIKPYLSIQNYVFATKDAWIYASMIAVLTLGSVSLTVS